MDIKKGDEIRICNLQAVIRWREWNDYVTQMSPDRFPRIARDNEPPTLKPPGGVT